MVKGQLMLPLEEVHKSNQFVRSKLKLDDVVTARIFTSIISCIKATDTDFMEYTIPVSKIFPFETSGGKRYALAKKSLKAITSHVVEIPHSDEENPDFDIYPLFSGATYKSGEITAQVHPKLKAHFIELASNFTSYNLLDYLVLSSTYAQRLFEILNSYAKSYPSVRIRLEELHRMLNTPDSLQNRFPDFRRRVLELSHREITEKTQLSYDWKAIKKGRSIAEIEFIFSKKEKEKREKDAQLKTLERRRKHMKPALACAKETHPRFQNGRCPVERPRTLKCRLCKEMFYFLN